LRENPHSSAAHAMKAACYELLGEYKKGLQCANDAIGADPHFAYAHYMQARLYSCRGLRGKANDAMNEALRLEPTSPEYYSVLSFWAQRDMNWKLALSWAERGLEHDPTDVRCLASAGICLYKLGREEESEHLLKAALQSDPHDSVAHLHLARVAASQGNAAVAKHHLESAGRINPHHPELQFLYAEVLCYEHPIFGPLLSRFSRFLYMSPSAEARSGKLLGVAAVILGALLMLLYMSLEYKWVQDATAKQLLEYGQNAWLVFVLLIMALGVLLITLWALGIIAVSLNKEKRKFISRSQLASAICAVIFFPGISGMFAYIFIEQALLTDKLSGRTTEFRQLVKQQNYSGAVKTLESMIKGCESPFMAMEPMISVAKEFAPANGDGEKVRQAVAKVDKETTLKQGRYIMLQACYCSLLDLSKDSNDTALKRQITSSYSTALLSVGHDKEASEVLKTAVQRTGDAMDRQ